MHEVILTCDVCGTGERVFNRARSGAIADVAIPINTPCRGTVNLWLVHTRSVGVEVCDACCERFRRALADVVADGVARKENGADPD